MNGTYIFEIVNRTIVPSATEELAVVNDNDSRYITFKIPSVIDGIDITDKILTVRYVNSLNRYDQFFCNTREVITEGNEQFVLFDWVLSADVTASKGTVTYDVSIYDTDDISDVSQYILHTKPATFEVDEGLLDIGAPIEDENALQEAIDSFNAIAAKYYSDTLAASKAAQASADAAAKSAASLKVDTTLTISGYAADAKTVGDKLTGKAESSEVTSIRNDLQSEIDRATDIDNQLREDLVSLSINLIDVNDLDIGKQINNQGDHSDYNAVVFYCTGKISILTDVQYILKYETPVPARFVVRTPNDEVKTVFNYDNLPSFAYVNNGYLYITIPSNQYNNYKNVYIDFTGFVSEKDKAFFVLNTANDSRIEKRVDANKEEIDAIKLNAIIPHYDIIKCVGDSQTGGSGGFNSWPDVLHDSYLPSKTILNYGNGGENVNAICYRCGTLGLIVKPFTLPADTTQVTVESYFENGSKKGNLFSAWNNSNPVTIDGIQCYLRSTGTVARVNSTQNETVFSRPVYALPPDPINKEHLYILLMGQNGGFDSVDEYLNDCYKCVSETSKYIIMLPYTESFLSKAKVTYNELLKKACYIFGKNVFNIKKYLIEYGLDDNNLTATETDNTDVSNGRVPHQLYADYDVHLNQYGLNSQAKGVYLFGKNNGYWN